MRLEQEKYFNFASARRLKKHWDTGSGLLIICLGSYDNIHRLVLPNPASVDLLPSYLWVFLSDTFSTCSDTALTSWSNVPLANLKTTWIGVSEWSLTFTSMMKEMQRLMVNLHALVHFVGYISLENVRRKTSDCNQYGKNITVYLNAFAWYKIYTTIFISVYKDSFISSSAVTDLSWWSWSISQGMLMLGRSRENTPDGRAVPQRLPPPHTHTL